VQGSKLLRTTTKGVGKEMCEGAKFADVTKLSELFVVKTEVHERNVSQYRRTTWQEAGCWHSVSISLRDALGESRGSAQGRAQGRQRGTEKDAGDARTQCAVSCRVPEQIGFVQPGKEILWGRDVTEQGDKLWGLGDTKSENNFPLDRL